MNLSSSFVTYAILPYVVVIGTAVLLTFPFTVADWLRVGRKIQSSRAQPPRLAERLLCARLVLTNLLVVLPVSLLLSWRALEWLTDPLEAEWPSFANVCAQLAIFFIADDTAFYVYHRGLHASPWLYLHIHKVHHRFTAPFAWTAYATNPVEFVLQAAGSALPLLLLRPHFGVLLVWLVVRQVPGVLDHVGFAWWPFARFHDLHHEVNTGNFASVFPLLDDLGGTRIKPSRASIAKRVQ